MPARAAHRRGKIATQELAGGLEKSGGRTVDRQECAQRQIFQIEQQVAVERDGARDRERREGGAVEQRQLLELIRVEAAHAALLDRVDQALELAPGCLARAAELAALEHDCGRGRGSGGGEIVELRGGGGEVL